MCLILLLLLFTYIYMYIYLGVHIDTCIYTHHASVVHDSGRGQLQANPPVMCPRLSPGKPTQPVTMMTTMGSNDLVVGEDQLLGPSCQRYNWQTAWWSTMAFGSSPIRGKTLILTFAVLRKYPLWKRLQEITSRKNQECSP